MPLLRVTLLSLLAVRATSWSFQDFFEGDWDMEKRNKEGAMEHAHYSLKKDANTLVGTYYEDGDDGLPGNKMKVRVLCDPGCMTGDFQVGKDTEEEGIKYKNIFAFDFHPQSDGRFYLSKTKWLGKHGGEMLFLAMEDAFVVTQSTSSVQADESSTSRMSSWTAVRRGAPPPSSKPAGKRSMLQRYGWYLFAGLLYFGYKAAKAKTA